MDLFKVTGIDELDDVSRAKVLNPVKVLSLDALLIQSPVHNGMELLHHMTKIGGTLLNKKEIYFSLFGTEKLAIPITYNPKSILTIAKVSCPTWLSLKAISTVEDVENATARTCPSKHFFTSAMPLPPFLAATIMHLDAPSPAEVFTIFTEAAKKFDAEASDETPHHQQQHH